MIPVTRLAIVLLLALYGWCTHAATYEGMALQTPQPDGTVIPTKVYGDEFVGWMEHRGYTIIRDPTTHFFCYAQLQGGDLVASGKVAGRDDPATVGVKPGLRPSRESILGTSRAERKLRGVRTDEPGWGHWAPTDLAKQSRGVGVNRAPPAETTTGTVVGLTLVVDFPDVIGDPTMLGEVEGLLNGDNYTGGGNSGSVKQYFGDVSDGALTFTNQVNYKAYLRMPHTWVYYNYVDGDSSKPGRPDSLRLLTADAIQVLNTYSASQARDALGLELSRVSVDASGLIRATSIFFAGNNSGVRPTGLWPMSWALAAPVGLTGDGAGKSVYRVQITNIGTSMTIGTYCHECGHMLCDFPDLYDYEDPPTTSGLGRFCLMSSGNWANDQKTPSRVSAYLRYKAGWVKGALFSDLGAAGFGGWGTKTATGGAVFAYGKAAGSSLPAAMGVGVTEYFLIESRPRILWDAYLPGEGLAIFHVDETSSNAPLSGAYKGHYECALIQADGRNQFGTQTGYAGDDQDLYPSTSPANNTFKDDSSPGSQWWNGDSSGLTITEIMPVSGDTQLFRFGSSLPVFQVHPASTTGRPGSVVTFSVTAVSATPVTLSWERSPDGVAWTAIPGATGNSYTLLMTTADTNAWFHCVATNEAGVTTSKSAQVRLSPAPAVNNTVEVVPGGAVGRAAPMPISTIEGDKKSCGLGSGLGLVAVALMVGLAWRRRRRE